MESTRDNSVDAQQTTDANNGERLNTTANDRAAIEKLRQEFREDIIRIENKIDAGHRELLGYIINHLEHHAKFPANKKD